MSSDDGWRPILLDGRVQCARRDREVDLSECLECNWLLDLDRAAGTASLRCGADLPSPAARAVADPAHRHVD